MRYSFLIIFITFLLESLSVNSLFSQTWNVKDFTLDDGLSQTQILCLHQDGKGQLWIGTNGGGLNIYNGKKFNYLTQKNGLAADVIFCIAEDHKGRMYFGTKDGLSIYDGIHFKNYTVKEGLPDPFVFGLLIENDDKIWIGTQKGLVVLENGKINKAENLKLLENVPVWNIYKDKAGNMWFGTLQIGLVKMATDKSLKVFTVKDSLFDNRIREIKEFSNGNLLVGTWRGVNLYDAATGKFSKFGSEAPVGALLISENDDFWAAYYSGLVTRYKKIDTYLPLIPGGNYLLFNLFRERIDKIYSLIEDKENNLWIGTENGLRMFPQNKRFYNYSEADSLHYNNVTCLMKSSRGEFWIGASKNGIMTAKIDNTFRFIPIKRYGFYIDKTEKKDKKKQGQKATNPVVIKNENKGKFDGYITGSSVYHAAEDKNGNIWIATNGGLTKFDGNKFFYYSRPSNKPNEVIKYIYPAGLTSERINYVYVDKKNNIWLGTYNGVTQITDTSFVNFNTLHSVFENTVVSYITEDNIGNLWFCTNKGAVKYDGKNASVFDEKSGFTGKDVVCAVIDANQFIWFGTKEGVFRYSNNKFHKISDKHGLASNNIYLMELLNDSDLFVATNKGLDVLKIKEYNEKGNIRVDHYGKKEGFMGLECYKNASYKDYENRLWFGTVKGITVYDPKLFRTNQVPPKTLITNLQIDYKDIDSLMLSQFAKGIDSVSGLPLNLVLPYYKNHITFEFVATSLSIPQKVKYMYILEGLNKDWTPPMSKNDADFQGLSYGTYTFRVKACNDDGVWGSEIASFTFKITPPFWKTWWFYTLLILFTILGIILFIYLRERKLLKEKEILEATVKQRTAEIMQQKEEIEAQRDDIMHKNEVLHQQKEEIEAQRDEIMNQNEILHQNKEEIMAQRDEIMVKNEVLLLQKEEMTKQAEELEKLSLVASATDNAVLILDPAGNFEWVNLGFTKMYGYTLKELRHLRGCSIFDVTENEHLREAIDSGLITKEPIIYEALNETKSGTKIWTQTTISPVLDETGMLKKLIAIESDISVIKEAQKEIMHQHKEITDSINYAKRIQTSALPDIRLIGMHLSDVFVLFKPKDVVSGDFYWFADIEDQLVVTVADCTGHGVPGAFMSMLGMSMLKEIVVKEYITQPDVILRKLRREIIKALGQTGASGEQKDGMDMSLCSINLKTHELQWAGANNPCIIVRDSELPGRTPDMVEGNKFLYEIKADKMPIAIYEKMDKYHLHEIQLKKGDIIYLTGDGFHDQFGGPKGKKFMSKHLKELLLEISDKPMKEQQEFLNNTLHEWMNGYDEKYEQTDDITVMGLRL